MRRLLVLFIIISSCGAGAALAGKFRFGGVVGAELERSELRHARWELRSTAFPGLYWEYTPGNVGIGMTYLARFDRRGSALPGVDHTWHFDWIGTLDVRHHFPRRSSLDLFIEAGIGNAGRADITSYAAEWEDEREEVLLSLFEQVGGGAAVHFDETHLGARVLYRFLNRPVPGSELEAYPLDDFHVSFFGGVTF